MGNLADLIENFILSRLSGGTAEVTILKRNELAEELDCAPSQISYVLSTRFTVERGFIVESRRGSGGFVRIVRIPVQRIVYEDAAQQVGSSGAPESVEQVVGRLREHGLLSAREAALLQHFFQLTHERLEDREQARILSALLRKLMEF
jgi:transcriptional regulator of stress and heat shock response